MKRLLTAVSLATATLLAAVPASAAIVVNFTPASSHIEVGESVAINMTISGLDEEILSVFDVNMLFDSSVVSNFVVTFFGAEFGGGADSFVDASFGAGVTGVLGGSWLDDDTLAASQSNSFVMLQFDFTGVANGVTNVTLGADPDYARNFVGRRAQSLDVTVGSACIAVGTGSCGGGGTVPEPAGYGLAGLALLGAGFASRRRKPV